MTKFAAKESLMSYTTCLFHIVFCTRYRSKTINQSCKEELRKYIFGIAKKLDSDIICMNEMPEHIHILANINATVSLSKFVGTIKQSSSLWLQASPCFPNFDKWAKEYYGVSVSPSNKDAVIGYIENQAKHHKVGDFEDEIKYLVEILGMELYEDSFYE